MAQRDDIRLHEMTGLFDLGLFPLKVCAGAVVNVLLTIVATRWVVKSSLGLNIVEWVAIVLAVNLLPVVVLRWLTLRHDKASRRVREMSFVADQHRFPLYVYLLASLNLTLWIAISWAVFHRPDNPPVHLALVVAAVVVTGFPAWIRLVRR